MSRATRRSGKVLFSVLGAVFLGVCAFFGGHSATVVAHGYHGDGTTPTDLGGTGIDSSGSTGMGRIDAGTWTVAELSGDIATSGSNATVIQTGVVAADELGNAVCLMVVGGELDPTEADATNDHLNLMNNTFSTVEANEDMWMSPVVGYISNLNVMIADPPGAGNDDWIITVRKNGGDTILTCTIAETETICTESSSVSLIAGDKLGVEIDSSGGGSDPNATGEMTISFCWGQ